MVTVEHGEQIAMTRVTCGHTAPGANRDEVTPSAHTNSQGFKRYVACADADQRDPTDAGRMTQGEGSIPSEATRGGGSTRGLEPSQSARDRGLVNRIEKVEADLSGWSTLPGLPDCPNQKCPAAGTSRPRGFEHRERGALMNHPSECYTVPELAGFLGIAVSTAYKRSAKRSWPEELGPIYIGSTTRFSRKKVDQALGRDAA